jgi:oligopeptide/dipeptide ABC transporter ATP-binding protein
MAPLLQISDLKVRFHTEDGTVKAVNGIGYSVEAGEIVGVVGESGSGKSAHALAIMQLVSPASGIIESGEIRLRDRDLLKITRKEMGAVRGREIAMIFQDPISSLNPVYTVGFQLREMFSRHLAMSNSEAQKRSAELLSLVGIPDPLQRLKSYPHELSGGMRQRVMIAMAISCSPSLLIADEPTTALDVTIQAQILDLIRRLKQELGLAVIWISHDLGVVASLAETVVVMYGGYIVEMGPVREIYRNPCHPYTQALFNSLPRLDRKEAKLVAIPGQPPDLIRLPVGCPFLARCGFADERCASQMPPVDGPAGRRHEVRCWHWQEVSSRRRSA